jgi:hypothetical protein
MCGEDRKAQVCIPGIHASSSYNTNRYIRIVDIIFAKKIVFLLGSLTLLGLSLIEFLRDRSTDSVEMAVGTIVTKAASKSFYVLEICCDGEGTVGALTTEMEQRSLRASIAGPD